jgi:DNA-binding IclR family transcriptional regulator
MGISSMKVGATIPEHQPDELVSSSKLRTVERALALLLTFSREQPEFTLTELSRKLGLSPSTIHRLLGTLQLYGFVEQSEQNSKYQLGLTLFKLGALVQANMNVRRQAEPALRRLARRTEETAYLYIVDNNEALCLDRVEGQHLVRVLTSDVGGRLPLNCGAAPRTLLAFLPDEEIQRLLAEGRPKYMTSNSLVQPEAIWADVQLTRARGHTFSVGDVVIGVAAVGAPVRDASDRVVAALSVAGITPRFGEERLPDLIAAVQEEARAISVSLGWGTVVSEQSSVSSSTVH